MESLSAKSFIESLMPLQLMSSRTLALKFSRNEDVSWSLGLIEEYIPRFVLLYVYIVCRICPRVNLESFGRRFPRLPSRPELPRPRKPTYVSALTNLWRIVLICMQMLYERYIYTPNDSQLPDYRWRPWTLAGSKTAFALAS